MQCPLYERWAGVEKDWFKEDYECSQISQKWGLREKTRFEILVMYNQEDFVINWISEWKQILPEFLAWKPEWIGMPLTENKNRMGRKLMIPNMME